MPSIRLSTESAYQHLDLKCRHFLLQLQVVELTPLFDVGAVPPKNFCCRICIDAYDKGASFPHCFTIGAVLLHYFASATVSSSLKFSLTFLGHVGK